MSWKSLPSEIQLSILESLTQSESTIFPYASVCRNWQAFIEPITFRQVTVTDSYLDNFEAVTSRRTRLIKYVCLKIAMPERSSMCPIPWQQMIDWIIIEAITKLFLVLARWRPDDTRLALEISIHSSTDRWYPRNSPLRRAAHQFDTFNTRTSNQRISRRSPEDIAFYQMSRTSMLEDFESELPSVPVVTSLVIQRQGRSWWCGPEYLGSLLVHLPNLSTLKWKPCPFSYGQRLLETFESKMPDRLRTCVMFEECEDYRIVQIMPVRRQPSGSPTICRALSKASVGLKHLSAASVIDAGYFFSAIQPDWVWERLVTLVLTSQILAPGDQQEKDINLLLQSAAKTVMQMPNLKVLELWNAERNMAGVFRYRVSDTEQRAQITWRATWNLCLERKVIELWEEMTLKRNLCELLVVKELLPDRTTITSHSKAIHHLEISALGYSV